MPHHFGDQRIVVTGGASRTAALTTGQVSFR